MPDDIREELTGDPSNQSRNAEVWTEAEKSMTYYLALGESAIIDATHVDAWRRPSQIEFYRQAGARAVTAVVIDTPLEIAIMRNQQRAHIVPERVLRRMYKALYNEFPSTTEGFNEVMVIDTTR